MNRFFGLLQFICVFLNVGGFSNHLPSQRQTPSIKIGPLQKINNENDYSPYGKRYREKYLKNLNSKNITIQDNHILGLDEDIDSLFPQGLFNETSGEFSGDKKMIIVVQKRKPSNIMRKYGTDDYDEDEEAEESVDDDDEDAMSALAQQLFGMRAQGKNTKQKSSRKRGSSGGLRSENFEVIEKSPISFKDIGGYDNIKQELNQCIDLLINYKKYSEYNVRIPKGVILEGPPGNGKTLLAKGFAGETKTAFIPVSGSQFQEMYVGVGSKRVRELFELAQKATPCIIFIDEIDAIGRKRSGDGETSGSERDNTLNELLVQLDGFKTASGIFLMGATNRVDLLDPALIRPGRIDKKIFIGPPDSVTREAIISIHLKGKPYDETTISVKDLVDLTAGLSGAQIENLLNEAMLNALRGERVKMEYKDVDLIINKIMVGWQPTEHQFSADIVDRIAIHEMGHAIVGFLSKHHSKVSKVIINLSAPTSPGYTMFETATSNIYTRESLFEHLMILLAGRIAEEEFYELSTTTGALNDFEEAFKLAERMIVYYGMGANVIYPQMSEKYKVMIDDEVANLINEAYNVAKFIVQNSRDLIFECSEILKTNKILKIDQLTDIITTKYPEILNLKIDA